MYQRRHPFKSDRSSAQAAALSPALLPRAHAVRSGQEHLFPPIAHLINAPSDGERARQLQALPDVVVLSHGPKIAAACRQLGFDEGADFMAVRGAALRARRRLDGSLPPAIATELESWRQDFAALAARESQS